jgi:hypothetical protein
MSKKLYYQIIIDDFKNNGCSEAEKNALIQFFRSLIKNMAISHARESHYELEDFSSSKNSGIDKFSLVMKRTQLDTAEYFVGEFKSGEKYLEVTAYLMEDLPPDNL